MNIKKMRNIHLYLGVFFSPLLLFFVLSGTLQTFELHQRHKSDPNYKPPEIIRSLASVHKDQRWTYGGQRPASSQPFRYLVLLMAVGLTVTTILGIVMAFKYTAPWAVWVCLFGGTLTPCLLLWLALGGH